MASLRCTVVVTALGSLGVRFQMPVKGRVYPRVVGWRRRREAKGGPLLPGPLERSGKAAPHDWIVEVNGLSTIGQTQEALLAKLRERPCAVVFQQKTELEELAELEQKLKEKEEARVKMLATEGLPATGLTDAECKARAHKRRISHSI